MHRIYKKEYNVILRSFISRAFVSTIVVSSLFACGGVSKEELEAVEAETKAAKEETEKVKKELGDKITALEGRSPAVITANNYTHIQAAVGLDADGHLEPTVGGSLAEDVAELKAFKTAIQTNIGLDAVGSVDYNANGSLAGYVEELINFQAAIKASVGLDDAGDIDYTVNGSFTEYVASMPNKIVAGVNALGGRIKFSDGTYAQITSADL